MSHTTDRDRESLDAKTDVGPGTGEGHSVQVVHFDREINVSGILKIGLALVVMAVVVHFLMWWLLRGFEAFESRKDVRLTPIERTAPRDAPPEPRLETSPNESLRQMRDQEDKLLHRAGWVDQRQGTVRVPIDVAIDAIVARGVGPIGTAPQSAPPAQTAPAAPTTQTGQGTAAAPPAQ